MKLEAYLGIDVGGSGARAGVVDRFGQVLAVSHQAYQPHVSQEGYIEIPIETVYSAAQTAAASAIGACGARIVAVSISSQGQTFVSLNARDEPLHPAIVWYDGRASEQADRMKQLLRLTNFGEPIPAVNPISTAPKIMWLRERFPTLIAQAKRFLLLPEYLAYRLTGRAVTDPATASSTGLYNQDAPDYAAAALTAAEICRSAIADIQEPGQPIAHVLPAAARAWGLDDQTLLVTGTNDQYAGAVGAGNCRPGIVTFSAGSCLALVTLTEKLPQPMPVGLIGGRFPVPQFHYALAFAKTAGVVLEWFNRELSSDKKLTDLDDMASQVPIGSHGLMMVPHFDGMVSPVRNPEARGAFLNLSLHHTRADMYRATLEALGYSLNEGLLLLRQTGFVIDTVRAIGGGARSDIWLQMIADITGRSIERPATIDAAIVGAAMLAALGSGAFTSWAEICEVFYRGEQVFSPRPENHAAYEGFFEKYVQLYQHIYSVSRA
jgi:xylulokinase